MRRRAFLGGAAVLVVAACSSPAKPEPTRAPAAVLAVAKAKLDATTGVTFVLTSQGVPAGVDGVLSALGDGAISATEPKFKGTIQATVKGVSGQIDLIAIGRDTWMKFFTPDYTPVDLTTLGAPNPADLFDPAQGISTLLTSAQAPVAKGQIRQGAELLTAYAAKVPGATVKRLLNLGTGSGQFDATFGIADSGQLRMAVLTGPFYPGVTSVYTLIVKDYGKSVAIVRP